MTDAIYLDEQWHSVQKAENDTTTEKGFTDWINNSIIKKEKSGIILSGCTLTTCISQTAMSVRRILNDANEEKIDIIAPLNLIGSRKSHAEKIGGNKSRIDLVVEEMRDKGIIVIKTLI